MSGIITIGVKLSLEYQALEVAPYQGCRASKHYSVSSLDNRGSVSRLRVTTLQLLSFRT